MFSYFILGFHPRKLILELKQPCYCLLKEAKKNYKSIYSFDYFIFLLLLVLHNTVILSGFSEKLLTLFRN